MSDLSKRIASLSPEQRALLTKKLAGGGSPSPAVAAEPIAVVGVACRLPGADSPEAFWELLERGEDAIREIPADRWEAGAFYDPDPEVPGKMATRWGGFLDRVADFDAAFFGIAPREAARMDPQQRLLLEVAWEALEDAGEAVDRLAGSATGVFVGIHSHSSEYSGFQTADPSRIDTYTSTGTAHSIMANRLSYLLDLRGPSLAVDTACSSSLVAVHLACQSLRNRECDRALAGGVNLILSPELTIAFSKLQMMAADGRCKTFDARADGFVRGEGCGLVVLKRLSDARSAGDRVLAVIRGNAVNQDGRTNGLTAPSGLSQEAVVRQALRSGGVDPAEVTYIEAHGTGTALGDPIEVEALSAVFTPSRPAGRPLVLASVKTNIGHLEAAAGIAGLIKAVLCIDRGRIPPHLHFRSLNPHISLEGTPFVVVPEGSDWPRGAAGRVAGVSSFGFGGTNAHIVLAEPPLAVGEDGPAVESADPPRAHLLPLSARSPAALQALARGVADSLTHAGGPVGALCDTAGRRRSHHGHRLAVVGHSAAELGARLRGFLAGDAGAGISAGSVPESLPGLAFVFSGQGPQWPGMGRDLLAEEPVFRAVVAECDALLAPLVGWSVVEALQADEGTSRLGETEVAQPALFTLQVGLAALWRSWGIVPSAVVGHSVGEVAAAYVAGALNLEDAVRVIAHRGRIMQKATGRGKMVAVELSREEAEEAIRGQEGTVALAAVNGPTSVVLSGEPASLDAILAGLQARGVACRPLRVNYAFHSPQMEPFQAELAAVLKGLTPRACTVPMVSTVTGRAASGADLGAEYWARNIRATVLFRDAVDALAESGHGVFLEVGPHPVLSASVSECLTARGRAGSVVSSLRRGQAARSSLLSGLAALYVQGQPVSWERLETAGPPVPLPRYPWQRLRHWFGPPERPVAASAASAGSAARPTVVHPLLGRRLAGPLPTFETRVGAGLPVIDQHRLWGRAVLPLNAGLEMALAAASEARGTGGGHWCLEDVEIHEPVVVEEGEERTLQVLLVDQPREDSRFQVFTLGRAKAPGESAGEWRLHLGGRLGRGGDDRGRPSDLEEARRRCRRESAGIDFYRALGERGFGFGPMLQGIETIWHGPGEIVATVRASEADSQWGVNPGLLMSAFLLAWAAAEDRPEPAIAEGRAFFPVRVDRFVAFARPATRAVAHVRLHADSDPRGFTLDLRLHDESGALLAEAGGVAFRLAGPEMLQGLDRGEGDWFYDVDWVESPPTPRSRAAVSVSPARVAEAVARDFAAGEGREAFTRFDALFPGLEQLSGAYVADALRRIGFDFVPGASVPAESLGARLGVVGGQRRLLDRLLEMLVEDGLLARGDDDGWRVLREPAPHDLARQLAELERAFPEFGAEMALLGRCGPALADVLRGTTNPLDLLFPQGSLDGVQRLYQDSPVSRCHNALVRDAVARTVEAGPSSRRVRILEVGAGTGGTTAHVLPVLPADRTEYVFTDVSAMFASRARETFAGYPFVSYRVLDAERDALEQGFAPGTFDLVLAANVVHATRDLRATLRNLRQLLSPGGVLVIYEVSARQRWIDLTFGLTDGWWRFTDRDLRPSYPLLTRTQWLDLFAREGWEEGAALPGGSRDEGATFARQSVLLARAPAATPAREVAGRYLLFEDAGGVGRELASELRRAGHEVVAVGGTAGSQLLPDPSDRAAFDRLLGEAGGGTLPLRGVVDLRALDAAAPAAAGVESGLRNLVGGTLRTAQALSAKPSSSARLFVVTRGVPPPGADPRALLQAPLWGLGRGLSAEVPQVWGGLIDLEPVLSPTEAARRLREELENGDDEDQVALTATGRLVPRLVPSPSPQASRPVSCRSDRAYLVTGGLGGLGLKVARFLVEQGARHLVLLGRTALPEPAHWDRLPEGGEAHRRVSAIRALEAQGARVTALAGDVADPLAMDALFARFGADLPRLSGVVHAAAEVAPCGLGEMDAERLVSMLRPKAVGALLLHERTRDRDLDFFVLFSSTTALWGAAGLSHYAAANAFLDQLALHRRALGLPVLSVNWGTWDEMRLYTDEQRQAASRSGLREMPSAQALHALGRLLAASDARKVVADVDWATFKAAYEARRARPFLSVVGKVREERAASTPSAPTVSSFLEKWRACAPDERELVLEDQVGHEVARVLGLDPSQVDRTRGFFEIGMDSLTSAELRRRLEGTLGKPLPSTLAFNYPNVEVLARYLAEEILADARPVPVTAARPVEPPSAPAPGATADALDLSEDDLTDLLAAKIRTIR